MITKRLWFLLISLIILIVLAGAANNWVLGLEITTKMALTSANLTALSNWDDTANSVTSAGGNPDRSHTTTLRLPIIGLVL